MAIATKDSIASQGEYPLEKLWSDVRSGKRTPDDFLESLRGAICTFTHGDADADGFSALKVSRTIHMHLVGKASYLFGYAVAARASFQSFIEAVDAEIAKAELP